METIMSTKHGFCFGIGVIITIYYKVPGTIHRFSCIELRVINMTAYPLSVLAPEFPLVFFRHR